MTLLDVFLTTGVVLTGMLVFAFVVAAVFILVLSIIEVIAALIRIES